MILQTDELTEALWRHMPSWSLMIIVPGSALSSFQRQVTTGTDGNWTYFNGIQNFSRKWIWKCLKTKAIFSGPSLFILAVCDESIQSLDYLLCNRKIWISPIHFSSLLNHAIGDVIFPISWTNPMFSQIILNICCLVLIWRWHKEMVSNRKGTSCLPRVRPGGRLNIKM